MQIPATVPISTKGVDTKRDYRAFGKPKELTITAKVADKQEAFKVQRFGARTQPSKGTMIFLCGGPGPSCVSEGPPPFSPPDTEVVVFDYLGVGQNRHFTAKPEKISIESQADAVVGIVKQLKLKDYIIVGSSFGTAVGTVAASKISTSENSSIAKPKMLVLDGVIGKKGPYEPGFKKVADRAWQMLKPKERSQFKQIYRSLQQMEPGATAEIDNSVIRSFMGGPKETVKMLRDILRVELGGEPNFPREGGPSRRRPKIADFYSEGRIMRAAGCQVKAVSDPKKPLKMFDGLIAYSEALPGRPHICDCPLVAREFDSKNFQVRDVPILYINGTHDGPTPLEGSDYHFNGQESTGQKEKLTVNDGGHALLYQELRQCGSSLLTRALEGDLAGIKSNERLWVDGKCLKTPPTKSSQTVTQK
jgi:pimeloyl-ACP methyl ester carboxylesterase